MKLTEQKLQQIIKEELDDIMSDDEMGPLVGAPLSPEEKEKSDKSYEESMIAKEMMAIISDLQNQGLTNQQIMSLVQQQLIKA